MGSWTLPFILVSLLCLTFSVRKLSDPDLGSHLNGGRWIAMHKSVPRTDIATYTVKDHEYIDINWLFQLLVYGLYTTGGYHLPSLFVTILSMLLFSLLVRRNFAENQPPGTTVFILMVVFLVIEPRIMLRPEMFTLIFISLLLIILDRYLEGKKNLVWFIPAIMVLWCNMHGLFLLGLVIVLVYLVSISISERKADLRLLLIFGLSLLSCLVNPYFVKGFLFPFELFTRLEEENIFHRHISELTSMMSLDHFVLRDVLFICYAALVVISFLVTWRKRKLHEGLLVFIFLVLALMAVRNIPLFAVATFAVISRASRDIFVFFRRKGFHTAVTDLKYTVMICCIVLPLALIPRLITNAWYRSDSSRNRTGTGLDRWKQPVRATDYLKRNGIEGRMVNSLAFGGWLAWSLEQPVFIDARLEVIRESLYLEVVESWKGNLQALIRKYDPSVIIYSYTTYFPWSIQLSKMPEWKLIYLDGITAVFVSQECGEGWKEPDLNVSLTDSLEGAATDGDMRRSLLSKPLPGAFSEWISGFYRKEDDASPEKLNMASFFYQTGHPMTAEKFFLKYLEESAYPNRSVFYALADIYRVTGLKELAMTCYRRVLEFEPENEIAAKALREPGNGTDMNSMPPGLDREEQAAWFYNQGNEFYRNHLPEQALQAYNKALDLNPGYIKALNNRGVLRATLLSQYKEAICDFESVIRLDPYNADAFLGRGICRFGLMQKDSACSDWRKAEKLGASKASGLLRQYCP